MKNGFVIIFACLAGLLTGVISADETGPGGEAPYPVGTTNLRMTGEFEQFSDERIRDSLAGHFDISGTPAFFSDHLQYPADVWKIDVAVPDEKEVYGTIAGTSLPVVMYVTYPTSETNGRSHYSFPFPDADDNELRHMQKPGEKPVFADENQKYPVVLISHGRSVHGIWSVTQARRLASQGYVVVTANYGDLRIADPERPFLDVLFRPLAGKAVLDHVLASEDFGNHVDPDRIAATGHSLGGFTSLALAGGRYLQSSVSFYDERITAVVAAAPWVGGGSGPLKYDLFGDNNTGLAKVTAPVLVVFGTSDEATPRSTILPAMEQLSGPRYVVELVGQPHIFEPGSWQDLADWELLFLSAFLKNDQQSLEKLREFPSMPGGNEDIQHFDRQRQSAGKARYNRASSIKGENDMGAYLPLAVWLISMVICMLIAKRRNVSGGFLRELLVVVLGPFAIPLVFLFKPETKKES